jgi:hypothetical protein
MKTQRHLSIKFHPARFTTDFPEKYVCRRIEFLFLSGVTSILIGIARKNFVPQPAP